MTPNDPVGFMLTPEDDDWPEPDPDDPRWYDDDGEEALTAAERNPSLLSR